MSSRDQNAILTPRENAADLLLGVVAALSTEAETLIDDECAYLALQNLCASVLNTEELLSGSDAD
jgi:hypothetical protein